MAMFDYRRLYIKLSPNRMAWGFVSSSYYLGQVTAHVEVGRRKFIGRWVKMVYQKALLIDRHSKMRVGPPR
jgi:hypothetical protein